MSTDMMIMQNAKERRNACTIPKKRCIKSESIMP